MRKHPLMVMIANRYEPTGNAAWGGMGEVYECVDHHLGREVMIKRVRTSADFNRLMDEKKALMLLRSKHVVQLLDVIELDVFGSKEKALVLEKIPGADLAENSYDPNEDYARVLWQIASGLADIHAGGIIHRDIKPENIRKDLSGVIKVLDFGLAREHGKDNRTQSVTGTKGYMAPELKGTSTITFTSAVDIYSFGATAIGLLKWTPGTGFVTPSTVSGSLLCKNYPGLNQHLAHLIASCLDSDPTRRPAAAVLRDGIGQELLRFQHRARIVSGPNVYELHAGQLNIALRTTAGSIKVEYNGEAFIVTFVSGDVFINNQTVTQGQQMPSACVLTFGATNGKRGFATFVVSQPEVQI